MTNPNSPIIQFYPLEFRTDLNGKKAEWEAVVLVPFIDQVQSAIVACWPQYIFAFQDLLLAAMAPLENQLTLEERHRNESTVSRAYFFDETQNTVYKSPTAGFADIVPCHVNYTPLTCPHCKPGRKHKALCDDIDLSVIRTGFPSFASLPHTHELKQANVIVFDAVGRGKSMVVTLESEG